MNILLTILLATLSVQAPKQVVLGKPFQITYTVDDRGKDLQAPEFVDFDHLAGPYIATNSSTSFVNGKRISAYQQTFTYTLMARREGTFTLGPATIQVGKERITSNGVRITVLPADKQESQGNASASRGEQANSSRGENYGENLFVRTIVTKTKVCEQEALTLTYKLYFAGVDVAQLTNNTKIPDFTGFLRQEIDLGERQTELEHYNGRNYQTFTLYQTLLYPQHSGEIKIEPAQFEAILRVQTRAQIRSIFDDFLSYQNVAKGLTAPGVTINVESLPAGKPSDYSGAVGQLQISSSISTTEPKANEAVTLKVTISGKGNMKLLKTPAIDWPEGFEAYDPKVNNNYKTTASGMSGTKTIEYLAIPRAGGEYAIPAIHFSYYDTADKCYKTLKTDEYQLHVARGANEAGANANNTAANYANYVNKEDIKQLGSDIRYIYTGESGETKVQTSNMDELTIVLLYVLPLIIAIVILIVMRKRIKALSNTELVRLKKAKKEARKHLNEAKKLQNDPRFWEEIERSCRAAENYVDVSEVMHTIEFARYAPAIAGDPKHIYEETAKLINKLEEVKL